MILSDRIVGIITIIGLSFVTTFGQLAPPIGTGTSTNVHYFKGVLRADSSVYFFPRDTTTVNGVKPTLVVHKDNGFLYFYNGSSYVRLAAHSSALFVQMSDTMFTIATKSDLAPFTSHVALDGDLSSSNEIQTLSRSGSTISLSRSGGSFHDSTYKYLPGTGLTISGSYPFYTFNVIPFDTTAIYSGINSRVKYSDTASMLLPYAKTERNITAGNGLIGGGNLTLDRTISLGTPTFVTLSSTNNVTATSHTHQFLPGGTSSQVILGNGSLGNYPTAVTYSDNGLMISSDKIKLDSIESGANKYIHPNSGVTSGTYNNVTVNSQGHVTAGSNVNYIQNLQSVTTQGLTTTHPLGKIYSSTLYRYSDLAGSHSFNTSTGIISITHPVVTGATFIEMKITVSSYQSSASRVGKYLVKMYLSGGAVSNVWNLRAMVDGSNLPTGGDFVRAGLDASGNICVLIGDVNTNWNNSASGLYITLDEVTLSHNNANNVGWESGWSISKNIVDVTGYTLYTPPTDQTATRAWVNSLNLSGSIAFATVVVPANSSLVLGTVAVTGAAVGDIISVGQLDDNVFIKGTVPSANQVRVTAMNPTLTDVSLPSSTLKIKVHK